MHSTMKLALQRSSRVLAARTTAVAPLSMVARRTALPAVQGVSFQRKADISIRTNCTAAAPVKEEPVEEEAAGGGIGARMVLTAEVVVSKIFPAGFGWQGASCVADGMGYGADSVPFFLMTGCGDGAGVITGHTLYYALKKMTIDKSIDMMAQFNTGILLGTAAFHAGTAWQPIVNALHDSMKCSFNQTLVGTWAGCGFMFFVGLRVGRFLYGGNLHGVPAADYGNLKADALLSCSIGGATACFVGTDVSFVHNGVDENWLRGVVGIEDGASDLTGMVTAGSSTAIGFTVFQSAQNVVWPAGKCWTD